MLRGAEGAGRDEGVDVLDLTIEQARAPPQLRRSPVVQDAAEALSPRTELALVSPQHVAGAHQPVLVRHVQLDRIAVLEHAGPAYQRDIVMVDDVEVALLEDRANAFPVDDRTAGLLGRETRERAEAAVQRVQGHALGLVQRRGFGAPPQQIVGVYVVDHVDRVAAACERTRPGGG